MDLKSQRYSHEWPCAARSPSTTSSSPSPYSFFCRPSTFNAHSASPPSSSVRFPLECSASQPQPGRGGGRLSMLPNKKHYCMCSPSTSPGSFRCSLHRSSGDQQPLLASSQSLNFRRLVMINYLLRLRKSGGDEEGYMMMNRALAVQSDKWMRSSSNKPPPRRRSEFKQRPTRFGVAFMEEQGMEQEKSSEVK